jgi:hypothetical protein
MKVTSNLNTFRKRFPFECPFEDEEITEDSCLLEVSRSLRPVGIEDYITISIDEMVDIYLTLDEAKILANVVSEAADFKGNE